MIGGVIPVLYSFYGKSGTLDLEAHDRQIAWVLAGQASGVTLLGPASEGALLTQSRAAAHCATFAGARTDAVRLHKSS